MLSILSIRKKSYHLTWLSCDVRLHQKTTTITNCYFPTSAADGLELDAFHEDLEEVIRKEKDMSEEEEHRIERFGS
ncbi:unnamed protein product [Strongylus vulgaris]|uniref:Uncharacterized protein n=1 Tax=Strongylus vulgaris TaxID=40348 RepID=A0A3P7I354_STRVU|nr:unnamed protein product [Strongylus vulgaris]